MLDCTVSTRPPAPTCRATKTCRNLYGTLNAGGYCSISAASTGSDRRSCSQFHLVRSNEWKIYVVF